MLRLTEIYLPIDHPPEALQEAVRILQESGPTARVLAGGTDIIVMARERRRDTSLFVDIKAIPEMMGISFDPQSGLTLGAARPVEGIGFVGGNWHGERASAPRSALADGPFSECFDHTHP